MRGGLMNRSEDLEPRIPHVAGPGALAFAIVILIGVGVLADATIRNVLETSGRVDHTRRVIADLHQMQASVARTVENRRNFTLTGDEAFARAALEEVARAQSLTNDLRILTSDNRAQQDRIARIAQLLSGASGRLNAAFEVIRHQGFDLEREARGVRESKGRRDTLTALGDEMSAEELGLLDQRRHSTRLQIVVARIVALAGATVSFALLWIAWRRLRKEVRLRFRSERLARTSAVRMATTLQSIGDAVITTDARGRIEQMNPVAVALTGFTNEEAIGLPFAQVFRMVNERTRAPAQNPIERVLNDGNVIGIANHTALIAKNGSECVIAESAAPIRGVDGALDGVVLVFRDMTSERAAERELAEAHGFLDSVVDHAPMMLFVKDADELRFRRFNRAGEALLGKGRDELLGKNDFDFFPAEQARFFQSKDREVLDGNKMIDIPEEPIDTPSGRRWLHTQKIPILDADGRPRYLMGISEDITEKRMRAERLKDEHAELERRVAARTRELTEANAHLQREIAGRAQMEAALLRSEEQLRQSQKMESLGRLAGGVAHDFNNLLSVILGYVDLWEDAPPSAVIEKEEIHEVGVAGRRAADLTRQLLAFSRQQMLEPVRLDLNERLGSLEKMLRRIIGEDVALRFSPAADLASVKVDPGQVEQVILNLVVNARDAMPEGGTLTIETANVELDEAYSRDHLGVPPGQYVMMAVSDTGTGMDAATQSRMFEPFYTSKERGKGTGLGLSTVLGIVQQSEGSVWVYSELGKGTTIKIYLPRDLGQGDSARVRAPLPAPRGSETILLVEDEAAVRTVARTILQRGGYIVLEATGGLDALELLRKSPRLIDLLLTDVVMPEMSGRELVEKATSLRPGLKVLFMSGYTDDTVVHHGVLEAGVAFLQKPLTPERLSMKVREVLDEHRGEAASSPPPPP
jgi:two-component system cell cycle sensor histidine kinase/response regulator CckA